MFGFLLGKELENGDIKYGMCFIEPSMDINKESLIKRLNKLLSEDRPAMLQRNYPVRVVSKEVYLGDGKKLMQIGGIEQRMVSNTRYYLTKDGNMVNYNATKDSTTIIN